MTIDNIQVVIYEFVKRLQLPESRYSFSVNNNNDSIELIIFIDDEARCALGIGNGTVRVVYSDLYDADRYAVQNFLTPVTLLYYLCMFFFISVSTVSIMTFNDLLSVVLMNEVYDWKTLIQGLSDNLGMSFAEEEKGVSINDIPIHYIPFTNVIKIDSQEVKLLDSTYTSVVEAMFKTVEYVANIMDVADNLFNDENYPEEENNLLEEGDEEGSEGGNMGGNLDMDIDINKDEESNVIESPEPVEPMENETFEEPQGPVVTISDLI